MDSIVREKVIPVGAAVLAVVIGWEVAQGSLGLMAAAAGAGALLAASRWLRLPPDALLGGGVLVGYLIGNRGFAQLHPPNLPLLPAEVTLGVALACGLWRWARTKSLPFRRDALNATLLGWISLSAVRLPIDVRAGGIVALRDFAMVYYALFFFLAQDWASDPRTRRWLERCLVVGLAVATPVLWLFLRWPDWFTSRLTIAGAPIIFVKGDVAGGFMAAGTLLFACYFAQRRRMGWLILSAACLVGAVVGNSRGSLVALAAGLGWLVVLRAWRAVTPILALLALGVAGLGVHALVSDRPFARTPFYRLYESIASVTDVRHTRSYQSEGLDDKPDNNQFRLVWWRAVVGETWDDGRWLGLGFGHDLASEFLRIYYAEGGEEFTARSPHSFPLSVFGRTGLLGLVAFVVVLAALAAKTWREGRGSQRLDNPASTLPLWLMSWTIFASACFGVVLEGPMGAVVFWITLGLANAPADATDAIADPHLRAATPTDELTATP